MIILPPEADLIARLDPELISQRLWDDNLTLGADTVSHTHEYNLATLSLLGMCNRGSDTCPLAPIRQAEPTRSCSASPTSTGVGIAAISSPTRRVAVAKPESASSDATAERTAAASTSPGCNARPAPNRAAAAALTN